MALFDYILVAYFSLNALVCIALIGKHRESITPFAAVFTTIIYAALILGLLFARGAL